MIFLFTGQPGSQKTANMIHFVMNDDQFKGRPIYYFNIADCKVEGWEEINEEQVREWYKLPEGSVLMIDEAQKIFRPNRSTNQVETITELETHRHHGFDIVMTTQHPALIHSDVRRQVQQHRHYKKPFGVRSVCHVWEKCVSDPESRTNIQEADKRTGRVPKKVFDLYKSTVLNTHSKVRVPKFLWIFAALAVGMVAYTVYGFQRFNERTSEHVPDSSIESPLDAADRKPKKLEKQGDGQFQPRYPLDPGEYAQLFTPRIPGAPHTAPVYDELVEPTEAPKTRCFGYNRGDTYHCKCVTQQMTPIEINFTQCVNIVRNGLWDAAPVTSATYDFNGKIM